MLWSNIARGTFRLIGICFWDYIELPSLHNRKAEQFVSPSLPASLLFTENCLACGSFETCRLQPSGPVSQF